jgi:hypothetical protein
MPYVEWPSRGPRSDTAESQLRAFAIPARQTIGNNGSAISAPAGSRSASPGNGGDVLQRRGACRMSSPMKRTESTRRRPVPLTPGAPCSVSM